MKTISTACLVLFLITLPFQTEADDSIAAIGAGGIELLQSDDIRMEEQDLFLTRDKVRTRFLFRNESDVDITSLVAFVMPDIQAEDLMKRDTIPLADMLSFTVESNGRKITPDYDLRAILNDKDITEQLEKLKIMPEDITRHVSSGFAPAQRDELKKIGAMHAFFDNVPGWNTRLRIYWEQQFLAGAQVEIYHEYKPFLGTENISPETITEVSAFTEAFCMTNAQKRQAAELLRQPGVRAYDLEYTLSTGASWKGSIRRLAITIEKTNPDDIIASCLPGLKPESSNTYSVSHENIKPTEDIRVLFISKE